MCKSMCVCVCIVCVCLWLDVCKGCASVACLPVMFFVASSGHSNGTSRLCLCSERGGEAASVDPPWQPEASPEGACAAPGTELLLPGRLRRWGGRRGWPDLHLRHQEKLQREAWQWVLGEKGGGDFCYRIPKTHFSKNSWSSGQPKN